MEESSEVERDGGWWRVLLMGPTVGRAGQGRAG